MWLLQDDTGLPTDAAYSCMSPWDAGLDTAENFHHPCPLPGSEPLSLPDSKNPLPTSILPSSALPPSATQLSTYLPRQLLGRMQRSQDGMVLPTDGAYSCMSLLLHVPSVGSIFNMKAGR